MDVKEESILGSDLQDHWYYVSKGRALRRLLRQFTFREVLDVGAGSGIFSRQLLETGICSRATCVDPAYSREHVEDADGHEICFVKHVDEPGQDLVLLMDVLEHVEDDVGLLRQYTSSLPEDGLVAITVPAFQFLWSGHDVFLEHHRRYTRRMLHDVVSKAGLEVTTSRFFFGLLFPAVAAMRLANGWRVRNRQFEPTSSLKRHGNITNMALTLVHDVERTLLFPFNAAAGLTLFCLARPGPAIRS